MNEENETEDCIKNLRFLLLMRDASNTDFRLHLAFSKFKKEGGNVCMGEEIRYFFCEKVTYFSACSLRRFSRN